MTKDHRTGAKSKSGTNKKSQLRRAKALELAAAQQRARNLPQAEQIYLELLRDDMRDIDANLQLAELYRQSGRTERALPLLRNLNDTDALTLDQCNLLGILWHQLGHAQEARAVFEQALLRKSNAPKLRYNLGLALRDLGLPREAAECFSKNLESLPDHLPSLQNFGIALRESHQLQAALQAFQRVLAVEPGNIDAYRYLALIHVDLAQVDEAIRCWEKVLELDPDCSLTHLRLSHLRKGGHDIAAMEALYARASNSGDRINLAFGLGKALEDQREYDRAFHYLREGNQLKRRQFRYSSEQWRDFFAQLKDIFSRDFLRAFPDGGVVDETPIFIIGMPRSGSSLVEQILASHPEVFGAGELKSLPKLCADGAQRRGQPFPGYFRDLGASDWREMGREYLEALRRRSASARRITDKLPQNFRFIGAISIMFPRARIVHCQRSPMDNCWSMYKNLFADGHPYTYDLQELGEFYSCYRDLMQHWNTVLPDRIYTLEYEKLVDDPDAEIAALLDFCGLPFDRRCLEFHKSERAVDTMSAAQVRRPINRESVERWTHFDAHLAPLSNALAGRAG